MVTKKKRFLNCIDTNHQPCPSVILDQLQGSDSAHYPRCFPHVSNAVSRPTPFWNKHTAHARDGWDRAIHSLALTTTFATLQTRSRRKQLRNWIALYRLRLWDLGKSPRLLSTRLRRLTVSEEWRPAWWQQNFTPTKVKQKWFNFRVTTSVCASAKKLLSSSHEKLFVVRKKVQNISHEPFSELGCKPFRLENVRHFIAVRGTGSPG